MSFQIIKQNSLTGTSCLGYSHSLDNRYYIWRPEDDAPANDAQMLHYLRELGFRSWSTNNPMAEVCRAYKEIEPVVGYRIADCPGAWNKGSFALPTGEVFCPAGVTPASIAFEPRRRTRPPRRSPTRSNSMVASPALAHSVLLTCLAIMFAAPLKSIIGETEPLPFELCGEPDSHIDLAGKLMASLFEAPDCADGIYSLDLKRLLDCNRPSQVYDGLATVIADSSLHMATLRGAQRISAVAGLLTAVRSAAGVVMINRLPIVSAISESPELRAELHDRLTTIKITSEREYGLFDSLPEGVRSSTEYARILNREMAADYGRAGPQYLEKLVEAVAADPKGLRKKLENWIAIFTRRTGSEHGDYRTEITARKFGLLYAGLQLAAEFEILPSKASLPSGVHRGESLLRVFSMWRAADAAPIRLIEILEGIAADPSTPTIDDRHGPKLRKIPIDTDAFVVRSRGARELNIQVDALKRLIPDWCVRQMGEEANTYRRRKNGRETFQRKFAGGVRKRLVCFVLPLEPDLAEGEQS